MRILVTGGSGFIGSHLVDALVDQGHDVVVVDRRPSAFERPEATYVRADLADAAAWEQAVGAVDAVSHQAARVGLGVDFDDVTDYVDDNDRATAVLLRVLRRCAFAGRLVVASSMVVYGEGAYRCPSCGPRRPPPRTAERLAAGRFEPPCPTCGGDLAAGLVDEEAPVDPRNVYAATKVHQEHLCQVFGRETGASVIALRYHNVYGPRCPRDTPYAGVASIFVSALAAGRAPQVFEDGGQRRDFVHVRDVVAANLLALGAEPTVGGAFNVASGRVTSVLELATGLWEAMGRPTPPPAVTGAWRLGDVRHVTASPGRATRVLGFEARTTLEEGLAELVGGPSEAAVGTAVSR